MLVDFGSSFVFEEKLNILSTTPEYTCPEILQYLNFNSKNQEDVTSLLGKKINETCQPWSFDVWSLGIVIIEIVSGFPVWLHGEYKQIDINGKEKVGSGVLAVEGRDFHRIIDL